MLYIPEYNDLFDHFLHIGTNIYSGRIKYIYGTQKILIILSSESQAVEVQESYAHLKEEIFIIQKFCYWKYFPPKLMLARFGSDIRKSNFLR